MYFNTATCFRTWWNHSSINRYSLLFVLFTYFLHFPRIYLKCAFGIIKWKMVRNAKLGILKFHARNISTKCQGYKWEGNSQEMSGVTENKCSSVQTLRFWLRAPADLVVSPLGRAPTGFVCAARLGVITESWLTKGGGGGGWSQQRTVTRQHLQENNITTPLIEVSR